MTKAALACAAGLAMAAAPASAHHGWSTYDASTVLVLEATILEASYQNPHGEIVLETAGTRWHVILAPPSRMNNRGLPREELTVGSPVRVEGYASRVVPGEMRAERIILNGRTIEMR